MQILVTTIAVLILAIGVTLRQLQSSHNSIVSSNSLNSSEEKLVDEEITLKNEGEKIEKVENLHDAFFTVSPSSTLMPRVDGEVDSSYIYPGAKTVSQAENSMTLESFDSVDKVTDWYKERIKNEGMNITSFVVTKANDKVLNKLVAADGKKRISVEIKKDPGESKVIINVVF